jgi:hypothetical protein
MDFTKQGTIYAMFVIPAFFAVTVLLNGIQKMKKGDEDAQTVFGFGSVLVILAITTYFLFIR